jgi:hypothetical protein
VQADLARPDEDGRMLATVKVAWGRLDLVILNACGGMERDAGHRTVWRAAG